MPFVFSTVRMKKNNVINTVWRHYDVTSCWSTAIYRNFISAKEDHFAITIQKLREIPWQIKELDQFQKRSTFFWDTLYIYIYIYIYITPTVQTLHYCPSGAWRWNDIALTSMWRHHIASTSFWRHVPAGWDQDRCVKSCSTLKMVVRMCWVNSQCRGVLLIWIIVGQGPIALAVGAGGDCLDIFSLIYHFSFLSPSLRETARYRPKYCLKGPLNPKQPTNQPTNQPWKWNLPCSVRCISNKIWTQINPFFYCSAWLHVKELEK